MEKMELNLFNNIYKNKRVLVTGNTGFKGSWLTLWLKEMGAQVFGISLPPDTEPNHWNLSKINCRNFFQDIRNFEMTSKIMDEVQPEIIFHLAAQTLVRKSYKNVLETWSTNVMGTANLLEICKKIPTIRAMVVVTTDKVYENKEWLWGYRENDALGGYDSYSASKAATELVVSSFRKSFFQNGPLVATARAGNVIGGGDWAEDRLIPDLIRAISKNEILEIRSPKSTRPWQHVLDCLSGYLLLGQKLLEGKREFADAWNFGPGSDSNMAVEEVLERLKSHLPKFLVKINSNDNLHEASLLYLDSSKAGKLLNWKPLWSLDEALEMMANWYREYLETGKVISTLQLKSYFEKAEKSGAIWSKEWKSEKPQFLDC